MSLMDVLSLKTVGLPFDRGYVQHMREKCLLSIMLGKIAHFPDALEGKSHFLIVRVGSLRVQPHVQCTNLQVSRAYTVRGTTPVYFGTSHFLATQIAAQVFRRMSSHNQLLFFSPIGKLICACVS